jgi:acyl-CoA synthetase (AMP-forming)/AMP-acid ligase II
MKLSVHSLIILGGGRCGAGDRVTIPCLHGGRCQNQKGRPPAYQHPRFIWFVDGLPLASTNKVDRAALHQMAEQRLTKSN